MINNRLSKAITALRGPMALLIVFIHADFTKNFSYNGHTVTCQNDIGYHLVNFLSHSLLDFVVPLFFTISGILYYESKNKHSYIQLIRSKGQTLLIPYLIWNIIFYLAFFTGKGYTFIDAIQGIWFIPKKGEIYGILTQPWDGPLWFLRDLMVVFLLSPIITFLIDRYKIKYILILAILYITKPISWYIIPGISITSILMFSIGFFLQYSKVDWLSYISKFKLILLTIFIVLNIITYIYSRIYGMNNVIYNIIHAMSIFSGIMSAFSIANMNKFSRIRLPNKYSFVIFASHTLFLTYIIKIYMLPFGYNFYGWKTLFIYCVSTVTTYIITYCLGMIISKNRILNRLLAGGR